MTDIHTTPYTWENALLPWLSPDPLTVELELSWEHVPAQPAYIDCPAAKEHIDCLTARVLSVEKENGESLHGSRRRIVDEFWRVHSWSSVEEFIKGSG